METIAPPMDRNKYGRLLLRVAPTVIESETENERVLGVIEKLMAKGEAKLSPEEDALLELLSQLVENFEKRAYLRKKSEPSQLVRFLLRERGLKPAALAHRRWRVVHLKPETNPLP
jgi:antitoxin component HigA of HigAB toxin-antitoxin module